MIGAANLSPVTKFVGGTGAVSVQQMIVARKLPRYTDFNYEQMSASRYINHYKFFLRAGAKQKP